MPPFVVAVDHPSLLWLVPLFVDELHVESRRFGDVDPANPKPFPSLVRRVTDPARIRFGVMAEHELVAMASLARNGEISMVVAAAHRGRGHGTRLLEHVVQVAEQAYFGRVFTALRRPSPAVDRLGDRFGWVAVDTEPDRYELVLDLPRRHIA